MQPSGVFKKAVDAVVIGSVGGAGGLVVRINGAQISLGHLLAVLVHYDGVPMAALEGWFAQLAGQG